PAAWHADVTRDYLAFMTASELAPLIQAREISPVDLVEAQLERIAELDGVLRAYIYVDADGARAAARAAESEIAAGRYRGPLHGVTVAHKDIIEVRGLPTTAGSQVPLRDGVAPASATVAARLEEAGAICLGKLNLFEFASGSMGVFGFARNPHHLGASPGASSAGSGVAPAAGLATVVTGTDTGGSVRNPACFCGLAGLRPTYGRVSRHGCVPLSWSQDTIGPLARSVADVALMLGPMAGPDGHDSTAARHDVPDYTRALNDSPRGLRIGNPDAFFGDELDPEIERALAEALGVMRDLGVELRPVSLPNVEHAPVASWIIAYSEAFAFHLERFRSLAHDYTPAFFHKITAAGLTSAEERITAQRIRQVVTAEFAQAMQDVDVIITAANRSLPIGGGMGDMRNVLRPVSVAGYPALVVPIGFAANGLPMGMQLIGRPWEEATLLRLGMAYERATGWNRRRPGPPPETVPPRFGEGKEGLAPSSTGSVSPDWVLDMARLLGYEFVTETDAPYIAALLSPIKDHLGRARSDLRPEVEPPTRPAGVL
ncbi:MAG TPA: amidase, partial [Chloroflexota bacterium]|nr:amidase [Chloroflexota bacterium]